MAAINPSPVQAPRRDGWTSYLLWEGLPFLMPLGIFAVIAVIKWDYEIKLFSVNKGMVGWTAVYCGPILFAAAMVMSLIGSIILFVVRLTKEENGWFRFSTLTLVAIFFIFPSMS